MPRHDVMYAAQPRQSRAEEANRRTGIRAHQRGELPRGARTVSGRLFPLLPGFSLPSTSALEEKAATKLWKHIY